MINENQYEKWLDTRWCITPIVDTISRFPLPTLNVGMVSFFNHKTIKNIFSDRADRRENCCFSSSWDSHPTKSRIISRSVYPEDGDKVHYLRHLECDGNAVVVDRDVRYNSHKYLMPNRLSIMLVGKWFDGSLFTRVRIWITGTFPLFTQIGELIMQMRSHIIPYVMNPIPNTNSCLKSQTS